MRYLVLTVAAIMMVGCGDDDQSQLSKCLDACADSDSICHAACREECAEGCLDICTRADYYICIDGCDDQDCRDECYQSYLDCECSGDPDCEEYIQHCVSVCYDTPA